jgi:flagellar motility protein MotE (MotC chaperone)
MSRKFLITAFVVALSVFAAYSFAQAAEKKAPEAKGTNPNPVEAINSELAKDLKRKQEDLEKREELVNSREAHLRVVEQDIDKKIEELKRVQQKLEELVKMRDDLEAKNLASLSKAYSTMPPADAAQRLKTMDRAIALKILMSMKAKISSKILSNLDTATAAQFTEQLAKRQIE